MPSASEVGSSVTSPGEAAGPAPAFLNAGTATSPCMLVVSRDLLHCQFQIYKEMPPGGGVPAVSVPGLKGGLCFFRFAVPCWTPGSLPLLSPPRSVQGPRHLPPQPARPSKKQMKRRWQRRPRGGSRLPPHVTGQGWSPDFHLHAEEAGRGGVLDPRASGNGSEGAGPYHVIKKCVLGHTGWHWLWLKRPAQCPAPQSSATLWSCRGHISPSRLQGREVPRPPASSLYP